MIRHNNAVLFKNLQDAASLLKEMGNIFNNNNKHEPIVWIYPFCDGCTPFKTTECASKPKRTSLSGTQNYQLTHAGYILNV